MVLWQPITNLKDYVTKKPPGVTFFLCLISLAISFIFLSVYSYNHILPNPDVVKDWNHLLFSIAQYHLCEKNGTHFAQPIGTYNKESKLHKEDLIYSTSVAVSVPIHARVPLILSSKGSYKSISLYTSFTAGQLKLEGNETFSATIDFTANESYACLTIREPSSLLSVSPQPPTCLQNVINTQVIYTEPKKLMATSQKCYSFQAIYDPTLEVMLTKEDQLVAIRHLLEVALVLLGVCLILCLSVSLTHSQNLHPRWKEQDFHHEPLVKN
ncbi:transmembrane protein 248-like isoform X2 [Boleophthalmus pectinirostris]|uniref:transmembrane protein 248-like isoform X2 n=1 Tax=Boleophthalmus pectinirostris TaxID=150288 RepID=UPI000A1C3B85|nr:transmembrane protein 248-like isoform X2 [Boleophthalmus pectinirostris]